MVLLTPHLLTKINNIQQFSNVKCKMWNIGTVWFWTYMTLLVSWGESIFQEITGIINLHTLSITCIWSRQITFKNTPLKQKFLNKIKNRLKVCWCVPDHLEKEMRNIQITIHLKHYFISLKKRFTYLSRKTWKF